MQGGPALLVLDIEIRIVKFCQHFGIQEIQLGSTFPSRPDKFRLAISVDGVPVDAFPNGSDGRVLCEAPKVMAEPLRGVGEID